ncbi:MAG TPA: MEDS domain-containing protein [Nitrososphaeraceae archaeon]|nr:MEDS domain-containing protein [Nitrososphaeraceae archaeon]
MMVQNSINCHVNDALHHIKQAEYGAHYMVIYPDLGTLRELYSNYIHEQIEHNNETVVVTPFYETTDSTRQVLSEKYDDGMNSISRCEKQESLIIIDALEEYFGDKDIDAKSFKMDLVDYAKGIGKNGVSILGDMGAFSHNLKYDELVDYELSLPTRIEEGIALKGFCLYHQKDFDRLSDEQKQKLVEHHGKVLKIVETSS